MGPLRCEHVFSNCAAVFSFLSYFSQLSNSLACRFRYCFRWTRFSFSSDTSLMVTAVSLVSLSCSSIKEYRGNPHYPLARRFRALCHPSMSKIRCLLCLTVRSAWKKPGGRHSSTSLKSRSFGCSVVGVGWQL